MQKALSMLESVLDDTLRESQAGGSAGLSAGGDVAGRAQAAAVLQQSREAVAELWERAEGARGSVCHAIREDI